MRPRHSGVIRSKIATPLGARPRFFDAAPPGEVLRRSRTEMLVHTGQHNDDNMSAVFFRELGIPQPDVHLDAGGGSHAEQTARMHVGIEKVREREQPDWTLIFGDRHSTPHRRIAQRGRTYQGIVDDV